MGRVVEAVAVVLVIIFLSVVLIPRGEIELPLADTVVERGVRDTGSVNLVTGIYLGYRAFDTLGETVVLLMAVSGVLVLVKR